MCKSCVHCSKVYTAAVAVCDKLQRVVLVEDHECQNIKEKEKPAIRALEPGTGYA